MGRDVWNGADAPEVTALLKRMGEYGRACAAAERAGIAAGLTTMLGGEAHAAARAARADVARIGDDVARMVRDLWDAE